MRNCNPNKHTNCNMSNSHFHNPMCYSYYGRIPENINLCYPQCPAQSLCPIHSQNLPNSQCPHCICDDNKDTSFCVDSGNTTDPTNFDAGILRSNNGLWAVTPNVSINSGGGMPFTGAGSRFGYWQPKSALRSGKITGSQWDDPNIGTNSFATGTNPIANGDSTTSLGYANNGGILKSSGIGSVTSGYSISNANILNDANGSFVTGYAELSGIIKTDVSSKGSFASGSASNGKILANSDGSHAFGEANFNNNSIGQIETNGIGSFASGYANGGQIFANGDGSFALGTANDPSQIISSGIGSVSMGDSDNNGLISASGDGSVSIGYSNQSIIRSTNKGSNAFGYAIDGGSISSSEEGASTFGYINNNGTLISSGKGSFVSGNATGGSDISATNDGSHAFGKSSTYIDNILSVNGQIFSSESGAFANGNALGGNISAENLGASAFGNAYITSNSNSSSISATGQGSIVSGNCQDGEIKSIGNGSLAYGNNIQSSIIANGTGSLAGGNCLYDGATGSINTTINSLGSLAIGYTNGGLIETDNLGSISLGAAITNSSITSKGIGSFAVGHANGSQSIISANIDGSFAHGSALNSGSIIASNGNGCQATGYATGLNSQIITNAYGSIATGVAENGGVIQTTLTTTESGSIASGYATDSGSNISANASGSYASGIVLNQGIVRTNGKGSYALGYSETSAVIETSINADGSKASGYAIGNTTKITSGGRGASASGFAMQNDYSGIIYAGGDGSFVNGYANDGYVESIGVGSFAFGKSNQVASKIIANCDGSIVGGDSEDLNTGGTINSNANASGSIAIGYTTGGLIETLNRGSIAIGAAVANSTISSGGIGSFAVGHTDGDQSKIVATGNGSFANGSAIASGKISAILGNGSHALGYATDQNSELIANAYGSMVSGVAENGGVIQTTLINTESGSTAIGYATGQGSLISSENNGSFASGNAQSGGIIQSIGLGSHTFGYASSGLSGTAILKTTGIGSTILGACEVNTNNSNVTISGNGSMANGLTRDTQISVTGDGSHAFGYANSGVIVNVSGNGSTSIYYSNSGDATNIYANGSCTIGQDLTIPVGNNNSLLIGQHGTAVTSASVNNGINLNTNTNIADWFNNTGQYVIEGEGSLQIAGGSSSSYPDISVIIGTSTFADSTNGSKATGGGLADFWGVNGADYAEYFEWADGNPNGEDRDGYFVGLDGEKIKLATNINDAMGIASHSENGYIGDAAYFKWHGTNLRDDLGRLKIKFSYRDNLVKLLKENRITMSSELIDYINKNDDIYLPTKIKTYNFESTDPSITLDLKNLFLKIDNLVPQKISIGNPLHDKTKPYIPRAFRKEWTPVSLLGKVRVRDDGNCVVGSKCDCFNGIAVPGSKYRILSRISPNVIRILFYTN